MCGIAGIVSPDPSRVHRTEVEQASALLTHRGPDAQGSFSNPAGTVAFGHRRLCIIDPGAGGAQPMTFGGRYTIVFNGELYNYIELRQALIEKGVPVHSGSDTEVVVAAYACWKEECLALFEGMFAFAIRDEVEGKLFAARDRMGEKPFYYHYDGTRLCFASEIKAFPAMGVAKKPEPSMLYNFLTIGYTSDPTDPGASFYEGIRKLPAASSLTYVPGTKEPEIERWWQVFIEEDRSITVPDAIDRFRELFSDSIRQRLRSDVAIGTSLSGGLDSSAVVAWCEKHAATAYSHQCFTATFPGFARDELPFAREVAQRFGLKHHLVQIEDGEVPSLMEAMMRQQDEPVLSASPLVQYALYQRARAEGVTVLLDGQGADELIGGYHHYYKWYWMELYRQRKLGSSGEFQKAKAIGINTPFGMQEKVTALFPQLAMALGQGRKTKSAHRQAGLNRDFAFLNKRELHYSLPLEANLNSALYFNSFIHGLEALLQLADRNSMAHGVEIRLPFLHHRLVSFLFTLPASLKIHDGWTKWILREAVKEELPASITWRKDKVGYEPPQQRWMALPAVQASILEAKEILVTNRILDAAVLNQKVQPHDAHAAANLDWKYWSAAWLFR